MCKVSQSDLSCLFLQHCKLLDGTLHVCLMKSNKSENLVDDSNHKRAIPVQAVQLLEAVCQPLWRSPYQAYE